MRINGIDYTDEQFMHYYYEVYGDSASLDDKEAYIKDLNGFAKDHDYSLKGIIIKHGIENGYLTYENEMMWSDSLEEMVHVGFTYNINHYSWNDEDCLFYNDDTDEDYFMEAPDNAVFD